MSLWKYGIYFYILQCTYVFFLSSVCVGQATVNLEHVLVQKVRIISLFVAHCILQIDVTKDICS